MRLFVIGLALLTGLAAATDSWRAAVAQARHRNITPAPASGQS